MAGIFSSGPPSKALRTHIVRRRFLPGCLYCSSAILHTQGCSARFQIPRFQIVLGSKSCLVPNHARCSQTWIDPTPASPRPAPPGSRLLSPLLRLPAAHSSNNQCMGTGAWALVHGPDHLAKTHRPNPHTQIRTPKSARPNPHAQIRTPKSALRLTAARSVSIWIASCSCVALSASILAASSLSRAETRAASANF